MPQALPRDSLIFCRTMIKEARRGGGASEGSSCAALDHQALATHSLQQNRSLYFLRHGTAFVPCRNTPRLRCEEGETLLFPICEQPLRPLSQAPLPGSHIRR